jgi:hypothetical protein
MGVKKRRVARGGNILFSEGGGEFLFSDRNIDPWRSTEPFAKQYQIREAAIDFMLPDKGF